MTQANAQQPGFIYYYHNIVIIYLGILLEPCSLYPLCKTILLFLGSEECWIGFSESSSLSVSCVLLESHVSGGGVSCLSGSCADVVVG